MQGRQQREERRLHAARPARVHRDLRYPTREVARGEGHPTPRANGAFFLLRTIELRGVVMETQARKPLHPLVWIAGFAVVVFCGVAVAAMMGWIGSSAGKPAEPSAV